MSNSVVSNIIKTNDLKPGDKMKNVKGEVIPNSVVMESRICAINDEDGNIQIHKENPIHGTVDIMTINIEELQIMAKAFLG